MKLLLILRYTGKSQQKKVTYIYIYILCTAAIAGNVAYHFIITGITLKDAS